MLTFRESIDIRAALALSGPPLFVRGVTDRHESVEPGIAFVAVRGGSLNGEHFAAAAIERRAAAVVAESSIDASTIVVPHAREAFGRLCHAGVGDPSRDLCTVGVTGTDGKTTSTWLLRHMLNRFLGKTALCGTIENDDGRTVRPSELTTPDAATLAALLRDAKLNGCEAAVVEISSHALHQRRTAGLQLGAAAVTNVRRDHLDYHGSEDAYFDAKASIEGLLKPGGTLVLGSVPNAFAARISGPTERPSKDIRIDKASPFFRAAHNRDNARIAVSIAVSVGCDSRAAIESLSDFAGVPGRWERISQGQPFSVIVDYAHTPAAVASAVRAASSGVRRDGRVIVVCGAGGDRDAGKRPLMGGALHHADFVLLTSDNPRSENPVRIAEQIAAGMPPGVNRRIEPDRAAAIQAAIKTARAGDVVLVLGKGHEATQTSGGVNRPFVDQDVCRSALRSIGCGGAAA